MTSSSCRLVTRCTRRRSGSSSSPVSRARSRGAIALPDRSRDASGQDPMRRNQTGVDVPHAMTTALRYSKHDELSELLLKAAGRFGRELRMIDCPDPEMAQSRTTEVEKMRERLKSGYDVDPRLVAAAIIDRLAAGSVAPGDRRKSPPA